ncbi:MAG TPA: hypothetical protein VM925_16720 [Labilithrix sp.]|nr:hypothetical protein [Labilithrix sp.]
MRLVDSLVAATHVILNSRISLESSSMRSFLRRTMILGTCLTAGVVWSGCEAKQATEYVTGISTQVTVPRDLKAVRVEVSVGGVPQFCQGYRVYDGKVQLPRSLGTFANSDRAITSGPITYTIAGVTTADTEAEFFATCRSAKVTEENVRILRRSRQPYIRDEILFLPMPLKYSCYDKPCGDDETCKGGKCVSATLTEEQARATFPKFTPDLVDGTGGGCFSSKMCLGAAAPAIIVNPDTCTYAVANTASAPPPVDPLVDPFRPPCATAATCSSGVCTNGRCEALPPNTPWEGTNVEVVYDGGLNREILDLDPEEGFIFSDPAKPQQFRLAPGLCEMVKGVDDKNQPTAHRITAVRASGTCQPKRFAQPFCAEDQLAQMGVNPQGIAPNPTPPDDCSTVELKPPRGALMVVVDNTDGHSAFFNADELKALEFPLKDPAFAQTDIGLQYAPGTAACVPNAPPVIPLESAFTVRQKLVDNFLSFASNPGNLVAGGIPSFEGALKSAYGTLSALPNTTYFRRAVVVIGNRDINTDQCPGIPGAPADAALFERTTPTDPTKSINTYVIQLTKAPGTDLNTPLDPAIFALAGAGSPAPPNPDARGTKKNAKDAFQQVINTLATCVYDVNDDANAPGAADTVSFSDPLYGSTTKVPPNAACNAENMPGTGWGYGTSTAPGKKRIFLCGDSCSTYRNVLASASDFALIYQQPPIAVPVFSHKAACEPK